MAEWMLTVFSSKFGEYPYHFLVIVLLVTFTMSSAAKLLYLYTWTSTLCYKHDSKRKYQFPIVRALETRYLYPTPQSDRCESLCRVELALQSKGTEFPDKLVKNAPSRA